MRSWITLTLRLAGRFRLDLLEFAGLAAVVAAVWFVWRPAGSLLVGGVLAVLAAAARDLGMKKT